MTNLLFVGIDDHEDSIAVKKAKGKDKSIQRQFSKTESGMRNFREWVERDRDITQNIIAAYEAGPCGPELAKLMYDWSWQCKIIAPHTLDHSRKYRTQKCDFNDAERMLEVLRGHYLAGNRIHVCWIPDDELRDHREIERYRLTIAEKTTEIKNRINGLVRRYGYRVPPTIESRWTKAHIQWLRDVAFNLAPCAAYVLENDLNQLFHFEKQKKEVEQKLVVLSQQPRHKAQVEALIQHKGVGILTAMVYILELGDVRRFANRQQIGSGLGLVPSQYDTGKTSRKGRITRCGPWRIRKVLNQAAWSIVRQKKGALYEWYVQAKERIGTKKAIVGVMRKLGIIMWHTAVAVA